MTVLPPRVAAVLDRGPFCHVAVSTSGGPHLTPMVFAVAGERVWVTTARGTVKARTWRRDARVAGLVRAGEEAVAFAGRARWHDALEVSTWPATLVSAPMVALASARFTRRNARFFAGYAVDAGRVPLAWTPPGRVFVELSLERLALIERGRAVETWGDWPDGGPSSGAFHDGAGTGLGLEALPESIASAVGSTGRGALAVEGATGVTVLPVGWRARRGRVDAVLGMDAFALAGTGVRSPRVALEIDRPSTWRARDMLGAMLRGTARVVSTQGLRTGATAARRLLAEVGEDTAAEQGVIVTVEGHRAVWWRGWDSGTVSAA